MLKVGCETVIRIVMLLPYIVPENFDLFNVIVYKVYVYIIQNINVPMINSDILNSLNMYLFIYL